jgi:hypothetical protein
MGLALFSQGFEPLEPRAYYRINFLNFMNPWYYARI